MTKITAVDLMGRPPKEDAKDSAERQRDTVARRKARGLHQVKVWIPNTAKAKEEVKNLGEELRAKAGIKLRETGKK